MPLGIRGLAALLGRANRNVVGSGAAVSIWPLHRNIATAATQCYKNSAEGGGGGWSRIFAAVASVVGVGAGGLTVAAMAEEKDRSKSIDSDTPLFSFGVVADIQYCDIDDAYNFNKTELRHYRGTLDVLRRAVKTWNATEGLSFVANLGDIIDGQTEFKGLGSEKGLSKVLNVFSSLRDSIPIIHMIGNHELYNFKRRDLDALLKNPMNESGAGYYSFRPSPETPIKLIVLNSYEVNMITTKEESDDKEAAIQYLEKHNPNNLRGHGVNWLSGMEGVERRYVPYNGALGERQLAWLDAELSDSDKRGDRVLVLAHVPLAPLSAGLSCLSWDYTRALEIFDDHPCVATVFAGHDHAGGYWNRNGVHYFTFPSPLNVSEEDPFAHAIVDVHEDKIVVHGYGIVTGIAPNLFTKPGRSGKPFTRAILEFSDTEDKN